MCANLVSGTTTTAEIPILQMVQLNSARDFNKIYKDETSRDWRHKHCTGIQRKELRRTATVKVGVRVRFRARVRVGAKKESCSYLSSLSIFSSSPSINSALTAAFPASLFNFQNSNAEQEYKGYCFTNNCSTWHAKRVSYRDATSKI